MPLDLIPGGPKAAVDLGFGAHDPQLHIVAPDASCAWEGFPVALRACPFRGIIPSDPTEANLTSAYNTGFGAGPFGVPQANMPFVYAFDAVEAILSGYKLEARVSGVVGSGTLQIGVANAATGSANDPSGTYYGGAFDTGWFDANTPDCSQAAVVPGPTGALGHQVIIRPFSPIVGAVLSACKLQMRWVTRSASATYAPFQVFAIVYGPPQPAYVQETLYDFARPLDSLTGAHGTSPPSGSWSNGIFVGDSGITADGGSGSSGHGSAWYAATEFASTCKVSCWPRVMPTGSDSIWLYARLRDPGSSSVSGYALKVTPSTKTFRLYRIDAGVLTSLGSFSTISAMQIGDGYELACNGDSIIARYHPSGTASGCYLDPFFDVLTVTDDTYRAVETPNDVGFVGLGLDGTTVRVYDFAAGSFADPMPGLYVYLETNSCGVLTKTFTQVKTALDAAGLGFTTTLPGSHGADTAGPDNDLMAGADCSGGVHRKSAAPL